MHRVYNPGAIDGRPTALEDFLSPLHFSSKEDIRSHSFTSMKYLDIFLLDECKRISTNMESCSTVV